MLRRLRAQHYRNSIAMSLCAANRMKHLPNYLRGAGLKSMAAAGKLATASA